MLMLKYHACLIVCGPEISQRLYFCCTRQSDDSVVCVSIASLSHAVSGQQEGRAGAIAPSRPSFGAAADRAAAHQFARSLSHKTSLTSSPDRQSTPSMPDSPFAGGKIAAKGIPETPQQGSGVPPSMRVRALSRQFSGKTQRPQTARSAAANVSRNFCDLHVSC